MSGEALYERYKDALKRGHVAALRGQLEVALAAYAEAARIAPERPTPHTSAAAALLRRRKPAEALRWYDAALAISPRDEAALLGRAQALAALDRRGDAADAFDTLAETRAGEGRLADAVDAARRGLELAEGRDRRRVLERLIARLRAAEPDEPGRLALERALHVLDGLAVAPAGLAPAGPAPAEGGGGDASAPASSAPGSVLPSRAARLAARPVPLGDLAARAEAALAAGQSGAAAEALLDLAATHAAEGRIDAALDACYVGVSLEPGRAELHLALADLYARRGWDALAADKLGLLERLSALDGDEPTRSLIAAARASRAPGPAQGPV